ncbi:MAG: glycoside hydrolase family 2 protein [Bacillota bacterium]
MTIPRPEHLRPQFLRLSWLNLNGEWEFCFDHGRSGRERGLPCADRLDGRILVPFCPESTLSGIGYRDFIYCVWYRRTFALPPEWENKRILLHFGAVDYDTEVWVNGVSVGRHRGGYTSFTMEITDALRTGENSIVVCAEDDTRSPLQPSGKQSPEYCYREHRCSYTRTTGIWQTVWLEAVPSIYLARLRITPDLENACVHLLAIVNGPAKDMEVEAKAEFEGVIVGTARAKVAAGLAQMILALPSDQVRPWKPGAPFLYDLKLSLCYQDQMVDEVTSYFGLRSLGIRGPALLLNGRPLFHRLVLDQGYYPDGVYTASTDEALRKDIELAMAMGFNGARLHQKVFEERFLYWADRLGYLVWGEMANWGLDLSNPLALQRFQTEWLEVLARDYNHPSIVGWCPFNETQVDQDPEILRQIYRLTKEIDPTRPCIDTSGWVHAGLTDVYDVHDYEQDPVVFAAHYRPNLPASSDINPYLGKIPYEARPAGQPFLVSEYGGIWWNPEQKDEKGWGYGSRPTSAEEFLARYRALTETLLNNPRISGFCYTQLTDVEQEVNGLYTFQREPKFDPKIIKAINSQPAAIEKEVS